MSTTNRRLLIPSRRGIPTKLWEPYILPEIEPHMRAVDDLDRLVTELEATGRHHVVSIGTVG